MPICIYMEMMQIYVHICIYNIGIYVYIYICYTYIYIYIHIYIYTYMRLYISRIVIFFLISVQSFESFQSIKNRSFGKTEPERRKKPKGPTLIQTRIHIILAV